VGHGHPGGVVVTDEEVEARIAEWRAAMGRSSAVTDADADELEGHLRDRIGELEAAGLATDEAFLIAVKRLGATDAVTAEFAREHGDRLWKQLVLPTVRAPRDRSFAEMIVFAGIAAVVIQVARILAVQSEPTADWFTRNLAFFVLPVLGAYFVRVRRMPLRAILPLAGIVAAFALIVNLYPFPPARGSGIVIFGQVAGDPPQTMFLVAGHLFVVLWFVVLAAYSDGRPWPTQKRMDAVRFTGEWAIYYVLIALGGGVLLTLTTLVLTPVAPEAIDEVIAWVLPSGAAAATIVAAWLVESKKSIVENLAPVLTAVFTPLFGAGLVVAVVTYLVAGFDIEFDRDLLTGFDVLLLVVVALVLYGLSARDPLAPTGPMDVIRLIAVVAAIVLDLLVLSAMLARVGEFGFTPNRVVALGFNVLLVVDLAVTAVLAVRRGPGGYGRLAAWQTGFLAVFAAWAAFVVIGLPPIFGFV
jgi:hypothetical protein